MAVLHIVLRDDAFIGDSLLIQEVRGDGLLQQGITQVFEMKECDGLSNEEIATELGITKRQTYYLYSKALTIGKKYNRN